MSAGRPASALALLAVLGPAPRIVLESLVHRGELAVVELAEARNHAAITAIVAMLAGTFVLLAGFAGTLALAAAVWERPDRGTILVVTAVVYLLGAGALGWITARRFKSWEPLAEFRHQLREDHDCLQTILPPHTS